MSVSTRRIVDEILALCPEWHEIALRCATDNVNQGSVKSDPVPENSQPNRGSIRTYCLPQTLFESAGAKRIYQSALSLEDTSKLDSFLLLIRNYYFQPMLERMLSNNSSLRKFWAQRKLDRETQAGNAVSLSVEVANKLSTALYRHLQQKSDDGFKVLLAAYAQRSVQNAVVDYVRQEWQWEKDTLQDLYLDPSQDDPRGIVADDSDYSPENLAISKEQVTHLNELRKRLERMLVNPDCDIEPLQVVDCVFGLGLTPRSRIGVEMTMRECCDVLSLKGDTQARKIARCQVLLDKGLNMIRDMIRLEMSGIAQAWQTDLNLNSASRRELNHVLGLTEGEVERVIENRQYYNIEDLVDKGVLKPERMMLIREKGAAVAFLPLNLNTATRRDIVDIAGCPKDIAKKLVDKRPFSSMDAMARALNLSSTVLSTIIERGGVIREDSQSIDSKITDMKEKVSINGATGFSELLSLVEPQGIDAALLTRICRARPFQSWLELEEFCLPHELDWARVREVLCL